MSGYRIIEIEWDQGLRAVEIGPDESGLACVVRRHGRPVGFLLKALPSNSTFSSQDLAREIRKEIPPELLGAEPPQPPAHSLPPLTIAVCTRNRVQKLTRCLHGLQQLRNLDGRQAGLVEILVVDNAPSDDTTRRAVEAIGEVRYVREERPGLDFARNRAYRDASGELIAYIDDDAVVDREWLNGLREAHASHPDAAAFTGQVLPLELETKAQVLAEQLGGFRKGWETVRYDGKGTSDPLYPCTTVFGNGCNMVFRKHALEALGGFDEALDTGPHLPGGGDLDMLYRTVRAGYPLVYHPTLLVFHEHRRSYSALRSQICRSWGTGCMAFLMKIRSADPSQRWKADRFIRWWFKDLAARMHRCVRGKGSMPLDLVLAEFWGAANGLFGGYERSVRRVERIRQRYA